MMPLPDLIRAYVQTGMLQFGRFQQPDGRYIPVSLNFLLLPSFPMLLQATARALLPALAQTSADRLLALRATTPLGAVLAVESGLPLTYHYGEMRGVTNAYIIEGAYDVGHPTTLLTYHIGLDEDASAILDPARKVGLEVQDLLCLCTLGGRGQRDLTQQGVRVHALFDLGQQLISLSAMGLLPPLMATHIQTWLVELG